MKQLHALILGPPRDPLDPQMPQPGICLSLLGLAISLPVQGAFVFPVWVRLAGRLVQPTSPVAARIPHSCGFLWSLVVARLRAQV